MPAAFSDVDDVQRLLAEHAYITDEDVCTVIFLAYRLQKPLLIEGPAGVGKTELAKVLAGITGSELIRLQCYEGLDEAKALYEWNYQKQLLRIQANHLDARDWRETRESIFTEEFLLARPLLKAILSERPVVLLIDELDKSDDEFESFLLEVLSDFQVSIPELGTIQARQIPLVVLTSNNTREFGDALKRRCLHLHIDYPAFARELEIVTLKVPGIREELARQLVAFVQEVRQKELRKAPGISETLDWAQALLVLGAELLDPRLVRRTLPVLLKYEGDIRRIRGQINDLLDRL
ncbi:MAG: MoxR family ATPase [Firmicutes bacterium]|nr:MoxR family ATPase [Bacillota bacterium]